MALSLSRQLLVVSSVILLLPWLGCQYIKESESVLQHSEVRSLLGLNRAAAGIFSSHPELFKREGYQDQPVNETLYLNTLSQPIFLDGYQDDWLDWPNLHPPENRALHEATYRIGKQGSYIYLALNIATQTDDVNHSRDYAIHLYGNRGARYRVSAVATGMVQIAAENRYSHAKAMISGFWRAHARGFTVELVLPLAEFAQGLGFSVVSANGEQHEIIASSFNTDNWYQPAPPVAKDEQAQRMLNLLAQPGVALSLLSHDDWIIAHHKAKSIEKAEQGNWITRAIHRNIVGNAGLASMRASAYPGLWPVVAQLTQHQGDSQYAWFKSANGKDKLLVVATPISANGTDLGYLVSSVDSEQYLVLADPSFSRVLQLGGAILLLIVGLMLGYASWLSGRVRRFSAQVVSLAEQDAVKGKIKESRVDDEIGVLIKRFNLLMEQVSENTDYLQTLARKLSHELRTPLAIIRSSLDNLAHSDDEAKREEYLQRASGGAERLSQTLYAMSEASRIESIIAQSQFEQVELDAMLRQLISAYQQAFPTCNIQQGRLDAIALMVMPDLIVQMLDKLVENAVDFCHDDGTLTISLLVSEQQIVLRVENDGPLLPANMEHQLFGNMVSVRQSSKVGHLGLGLHIVKLIVQAHQGAVSAHNRKEGTGVHFDVCLPIS